MAEMLGEFGEFEDIDGNVIKGQRMRCDCGNYGFEIFWLDKQDHPHFECTECKVTFCGTFDGTQCERSH